MRRETRLRHLNGLAIPRRRTQSTRYLTAEYVKSLQERIPELREYDKKGVRDLVKLLNETMMQIVLDERDGIELPEGLGQVFIASCPKPKLTAKAKKIREGRGGQFPNLMLKTDDHVPKVFYSNERVKYKFHNRELWGFKPSKEFRSKLYKIYPEKWNTYIKLQGTNVKYILSREFAIKKQMERGEEIKIVRL